MTMFIQPYQSRISLEDALAILDNYQTEYIATWIESSDDYQIIIAKLAEFGIVPQTVIRHACQTGVGVSIRYTFKATEQQMLEWREVLIRYNLDPFYVR